MKPWILWLIAGVVFFLVEMLAPTAFFFACLGVAALVSAGVSAVIPAWWVPWAAFLAASVVTVLLTRPLAKKLQKGQVRPSNVDEMIGQRAHVTVAIDPAQGAGEVKVRGETWRALAGSKINQGVSVRVSRVEGTHLFVEPEGGE